MTISNLAQECIYSPNHYWGREYPIAKVTIHHMAGDLSIWSCGMIFQNPSREASSNYGVDSQGRIACYVDEENAAWTSSSYWNDNQAITIEVADYDCVNWVPSDAAYNATIQLCADICNRYGIWPSYTGWTDGTFTEHLMFAATGCPGEWWHSHMPQVVNDVIAAMNGQTPQPIPTPTDNIRYRVSTDQDGREWLPEMVGVYDTSGSGDDFAGIYGDSIRWLAIDGVGKYRVCTSEGGWLPWVDSYDVHDLEFGCAGDGSEITAVEIPNSNVRYQVHSGKWFADMLGNHDTGGTSDTFAGAFVPIDAIRVRWN